MVETQYILFICNIGPLNMSPMVIATFFSFLKSITLAVLTLQETGFHGLDTTVSEMEVVFHSCFKKVFGLGEIYFTVNYGEKEQEQVVSLKDNVFFVCYFFHPV